jgi:hypothetical protein
MVRGLDLFRERFRPFHGLMTLIGGAACDEWFTTNGLTFRATNDLDLVIMMDDVARRGQSQSAACTCLPSLP